MRGRSVSLKKMVFLFWGLMAGLFLALFLFYTIGILENYREEDRRGNQFTVDGYAEELNRELQSMFSNVNMTYAENVNYARLRHEGITEFDWYGTVYLLENNLSSYVKSMDCMGAMYFFDMTKNAFRFVWNQHPFSGSENLLNRKTKSFLRDTLSGYRNSGYFLYEDELYFCYSYGSDGKYVGCMMNLSRYFPESEIYELAYADQDGRILSAGGAKLAGEQELREALAGREASDLNENFSLVRALIPSCDMELVLVHRQITLFETLFHSNLRMLLLTVPVLLIGGLILFLKVLNQVLLHPVEYLVAKFQELKEPSGARRREAFGVREFEDINQKMDQMLADIVLLREEKYREKDRANTAQLQYYRLQTNPHFFLNCLNTICSLLENGKEVAAKDMIYALSSHFRYVFQDQKSLVAVEDEIREVRAYCKMYSLKGGIPIYLTIEAGDEAQGRRIPILTIQTFVENSIKHGGRQDDLLSISVVVRCEKEAGEEILFIQVSDNGKGYPEEELEKLNRPVGQFEYKSKHVGLDNLRYRICLLYGEGSGIRCCNAPLGGAVTEIWLREAKHEHTDY